MLNSGAGGARGCACASAILCLTLAGCSPGAGSGGSRGDSASIPQPAAVHESPPAAGRFHHDPALFAILNQSPGPAQYDSLLAYEARSRLELTDTLADIAGDSAQHPLLRANAVLLLGRRHAIGSFLVFEPLLAAHDERIRVAAVTAAREYLPVQEAAVLKLLDKALRDPSAAVQAKALESMTDRDPDLLRAYVKRGPPIELARVASELIAVAEERGAPLVADSGGLLERTGPAGHRLRYRPLQRWPEWGLSSGVLQLTPAGGSPVTLGDSIEVAHNVVPAFFSSDGRWLVYEKRRRIVVREVASGSERMLGEGVAPRPLPFTEDFVFARELKASGATTRAGTLIRYQLMRAPFSPAAARSRRHWARSAPSRNSRWPAGHCPCAGCACASWKVTSSYRATASPPWRCPTPSPPPRRHADADCAAALPGPALEAGKRIRP